MREGFIGNADTFILFFWLCKRYSIDDEKGRIELLRKLVKAKRLKYERDANVVLKGKRCLTIKPSSNAANG